MTVGGSVRAAVASPGKDQGSTVAKSMYADLMAVDPYVRRVFYRDLAERELDAIVRVAFTETGSAYGLWVDDPIGFVEDVLGETTWSKQREVLEAIPHYKQVAVPSAFDTGKTHIAARAALWRALVYAPGTSLTVTTATRFRQVQRQLWPHIRAAVAKANLPLKADTTQLKATNSDGVEIVVAYGFTAPPQDESAVQGIHSPVLFIVVDEAGGISRVIGSAMRGLMTGGDTRMLAIGNPPTDDEGSWFEKLCADDTVKTIPISAYDAPLQSGEKGARCRACPPEVPRHSLGVHLVDREWIDGTIRDYGADSPFVKAKVHAKFPRGGTSRAIPADWVDLCVESPEPMGEGYVRLCDLGLPDEDSEHVVKMGAWIRLGVDVAAEGGDEFVVSRCVGDLLTVEHTSAGAVNANAVDVAGKVLEQIRRAEQLRTRLGTTARIRVKVDAIGVGWGVASTLKAWGSEQIHDADIVSVVVSEDTHRDDEGSTLRPYRKRDEMWLSMRSLLQPRPDTGRGALRLRIGGRAVSQLSAPKYGTSTGGRTVIESKKNMKARGLNSPDQAEALILSTYEPILKRGVFKIIV